MSIITAQPNVLIRQAAAELKKLGVSRPGWADYVKTGVSRERPPQQADWWETRAAAVLRKLATGRQLGTQRLRRLYGGRKNRGHKPEHVFPASGSVIREILQQLEAAGLVVTVQGKGREITSKGRKLLAESAKVAG